MRNEEMFLCGEKAQNQFDELREKLQHLDSANIQTLIPNYAEYCFNRLPCGLCRLTNQMCAMLSNKMEINYSATSVNAKEAEK